MTDPRALRSWMVAGPEVVRMVTEFETPQAHGQSTEHRHHEQHPGVQTAFLKYVKSLVAVIEEMGNPFLEKSEHLTPGIFLMSQLEKLCERLKHLVENGMKCSLIKGFLHQRSL